MKLSGSYNQNEMNFTRKSNAKFMLFKGQFWSFLVRKNIKPMKFNGYASKIKKII